MKLKKALCALLCFLMLICTFTSFFEDELKNPGANNEITEALTELVTEAETEAVRETVPLPEASFESAPLQDPYPVETAVQTDLPVIENPISKAELLLGTMTIEEKVAQLFIAAPEQLTGTWGVTSYNYDTLPYGVGGVILFAANIETPSQCMALIDSLQNASAVPLFVSVDEEGGRIARIGNNSAMGTTKFPNMAEILGESAAYNVGETIGREIKALGFNLDFAPVCDVNSNPNNPVIGTRSFGENSEYVSRMVKSAVEGFRASGMLCTLKHFPGHGDTGTDSHTGYTELGRALDELRLTELPPFYAGIEAGAEFVMVGHISTPNITGNKLPATLSPEIIKLLREELGFGGLVITDSMRMGAITKHYTSADAAVMAISAGVDMILMPEDLGKAISGVVSAVNCGIISEERINESVLRVLDLKISSGIIE